nr:hypothetical protein GCM10025730_31940 [Promicromonospora thailandica]
MGDHQVGAAVAQLGHGAPRDVRERLPDPRVEAAHLLDRGARRGQSGHQLGPQRRRVRHGDVTTRGEQEGPAVEPEIAGRGVDGVVRGARHEAHHAQRIRSLRR